MTLSGLGDDLDGARAVRAGREHHAEGVGGIQTELSAGVVEEPTFGEEVLEEGVEARAGVRLGAQREGGGDGDGAGAGEVVFVVGEAGALGSFFDDAGAGAVEGDDAAAAAADGEEGIVQAELVEGNGGVFTDCRALSSIDKPDETALITKLFGGAESVRTELGRTSQAFEDGAPVCGKMTGVSKGGDSAYAEHIIWCGSSDVVEKA